MKQSQIKKTYKKAMNEEEMKKKPGAMDAL